MVNSLLLIAVYLVKLIIVNATLFYIFKLRKLSVYYVIPLYSIVISSSTILPIYIDIVHGYLINYLILLTVFSTYYMYFRDKQFLVIGFTYLFLYFFVCAIPYVVTNCSVYSLSCVYTSVLSPILMKYVVFTVGLILLILLNTIVGQYSRLDYVLLHVVSIIYGLSQYIVLIKSIDSIFYSIVTIVLTPLIYYTGKYVGYYVFLDEESLERVFDKYVSINALSVFLALALFTLYSVLRG